MAMQKKQVKPGSKKSAGKANGTEKKITSRVARPAKMENLRMVNFPPDPC